MLFIHVFRLSGGYVSKQKIKAKEKFTVEKWPQKIKRMDWSANYCWQFHVFFSFLLLFIFFLTVFQGHFTDTFLRHHIKKPVFLKFYFSFGLLNMGKLCLKFELFFFNLFSKILADLDIELQLFNVLEFCVGKANMSWKILIF